jgi:hypothetical protein
MMPKHEVLTVIYNSVISWLMCNINICNHINPFTVGLGIEVFNPSVSFLPSVSLS